MLYALTAEPMARNFAVFVTAMWNRDSDFRTLPSSPQRTYMMLSTQPDISACGVLTYSPGRWARHASDTTKAGIEADVGYLAERRYVVLDADTDELWIRAFMKVDRAWPNPKRLPGIITSIEQVLSLELGELTKAELQKLIAESGKPALLDAPESAKDQQDTLFDRQPDSQPDSHPDRVLTRDARNPDPYPDPDPDPKSTSLAQRRNGRSAVGSDDDPHFAAFWDAYPRKVGKGQARTAWRRAVQRHDPAGIVRSAAAFAADPVRQQRGSQFTPHPATWLNGERWHDADEHLPAQPAVGPARSDLRVAGALELANRLEREDDEQRAIGGRR